MKPYTDIEQSRLNTMTQEEKAKAYDKAVERAKSKIKNDKDHVLYEDDVIELFPELAESEDEKTRKEITEFFKNFSEHGTWKAISDVTRWIAWLEKQGEKPNNVYDKELSEILGCVIRRYINDPNISYTEREKVSKKIIPYVERLEKQGEQNTANKVEPKFKVGDTVRFKGNETLKGEAETHKIVGYDNELYVFADGTTDLFCEQELYELVEQKSIAWSEEDEDMLQSILDEYKSMTTEKRNWLKSIKDIVQPQTKQEWSEEDEYVFNKILNWCVLVNPTSSIFEELPKDKFVEIFKSLKDRVQSQIIAGDNQCK